MEWMHRIAAMLLIAGALSGQTQRARKPAATPPEPNAIRELRVEGASFYSPAQVIALSGLKLGDSASKQNFERARDRVMASGNFESFGWKYDPLPNGEGVVATLQVTEPTTFYPWALDRISLERAAVDARLVQKLPLFTEKIPASELYIDRVAGVIQEMLKEKGVNERVTGRVTLLGKDQITVLFGPGTPPPNVAEVKFVGAKIVDARYLVKSLSEIAIGTPYIEENFRMLLENQIRPMYEAAGHLRVKFSRVTVEPSSKAPNGVLATVQVDEGPAIKLKSIEVRGTPLSPDEIQNLGLFKEGETVSYSEIGKGMIRIMDELKSTGYMTATYKSEQKLDETNSTVELLIDVSPGPQYTFGRLLIKGLDLESEPVVRKLWSLKTGEPYKSNYPNYFLNQLRERDLFDNLGETKAEPQIDERRQTVDVLLIFKGQPPQPRRQPGIP